jgi:geranylgeranyl diphosphate synthase type I
MDHDRLLEEYTGKIESLLIPYLEELTRDASAYHPFMGGVYESLAEFVLRGGKRLASSSTLLTYKGYKGALDEGILTVARGVELYRHAILVHDDLVDMDDYRRGGETVQRRFAKGFDERFGMGAAVFSGNILLTLAFESFLESGFPHEKILKVMQLFGRNERAVNESQILDQAFEYKRPTYKEWEVMASKRAVSLFNSTLLTGAILGDAPRDDMKPLDQASHHIGFSFDIQDDIIGTFADEEEYGRPAGGDLRFWKKPLHMVYTLEMAGEEEIREIEGLVGKTDITREEMERVREIIRNCGALERAKEKSRDHAEKAIEFINKTKMDQEVKDFFTSFIGYVADSLEWYK